MAIAKITYWGREAAQGADERQQGSRSSAGDQPVDDRPAADGEHQDSEPDLDRQRVRVEEHHRDLGPWSWPGLAAASPGWSGTTTIPKSV